MIMKIIIHCLIILLIWSQLKVSAVSNGSTSFYYANNTGVGIKTTNAKLTLNGNMAVIEGSNPTNISDYGKFFVKSSDSELYFMDDSGNLTKITNNGSLFYNDTTGNALGDVISDPVYDQYWGEYAGVNDSSTNYNTAVGIKSLRSVTTGVGNLAIGYESLNGNTTGSYNTAVGYSTLSKNIISNGNTAVGHLAQSASTGNGNTTVGHQSGTFKTGNGNTAIGRMTLSDNGNDNIAIGSQATRNIIGDDNVGIGTAIIFATEGSKNIGVGGEAIYQGYYTDNNIAFGFRTMRGDASWSFNNSYNIALGKESLRYVTTGSENIALGKLSFTTTSAGLSTGDRNMAIGHGAGSNLTIGNDNLIIGYDNDAVSATGSNQIDIADTIYINNSTKKVGLGTSSPTVLLDIESGAASDGIDINNTAADGDPRIAFQLSDVSFFTMGVDDSDADKFKIGTTSIDTSTSLVIDASGNIGLGNSSPARTLHISDLMKLEPRSTAPTSPAAGDVYVDSTSPEALCIYLNSAWVVAAGSGACS